MGIQITDRNVAMGVVDWEDDVPIFVSKFGLSNLQLISPWIVSMDVQIGLIQAIGYQVTVSAAFETSDPDQDDFVDFNLVPGTSSTPAQILVTGSGQFDSDRIAKQVPFCVRVQRSPFFQFPTF